MDCVQSFVDAHHDGASDESSWSQLCTLLGFHTAPARPFQDWLRSVPTDPHFRSVERKWVHAVFDSLDDLLPEDNNQLALLNVPRVVSRVFGKEVDAPPCALAIDIMARTTAFLCFGNGSCYKCHVSMNARHLRFDSSSRRFKRPWRTP